jgi:hypothetical protein
MRNWLLIVALFSGTLHGLSQTNTTSPEQVQEIPMPKGMNQATLMPIDMLVFDFERVGIEPPHWGFEINKDGHGRYYVKSNPTEGNPSGNDWHDVVVGQQTLEMLMQGLAKVGTGKGCETKAKNIANTGKKKLSYVHSDIWFTCEFNYSDDEGVMKAAGAFQSMAATMQTGERLKHSLRYDRLGLDAEMDALVEEVQARRALEVQNIAPVLQAIIDDDRVIERVRRKAAHLLEGAGVPVRNYTP